MGWQGRMRGIKAERLFAKLPAEIREGATLVRVSCWRDDDKAYVMYRKGHPERWYSLRVDRATGSLLGDPYLVRSPMEEIILDSKRRLVP